MIRTEMCSVAWNVVAPAAVGVLGDDVHALA